jgi:microcin C transport system substrate-binding protein
MSYYPNSEFSATGLPVGHEWLMLKPYKRSTPARLFTEPFSLPQTHGRGIPRETMRKALAPARRGRLEAQRPALAERGRATAAF